MADAQRGRGRAKARGQQQQQQQGQPQGPRPGSSHPGARGGRPPQAPGSSRQGPPPSQQQLYAQRAPAPQQQFASTGGRATSRPESIRVTPAAVVTGTVSEAGDVALYSGRGAVRGRRNIVTEILTTKPSNLNSKKGSYGTSVRLYANYFEVKKHADWCLYQYRVDFDPQEDSTVVRKGMLKSASKDHFKGYIFDGTVLYTSHRLPKDPLEIFAQPKNPSSAPVRITIRLVGDVALGDFHYLQVFNVLLRKCLGHLKLQLVGRNFFDAAASILLREHSMELWPGYLTSIRQHENNVLLTCEIAHKVMRQETVLSLLQNYTQSGDNWMENFKQEVIGTVVLTDYNNRTYRIDDVDFDVTVSSKFAKGDGSQISYADYYREKYNIKIQNQRQPMLVSRAKARELRAGKSELIYLVPELCRMTGLTDRQRNNFRLMRALADHTRVGAKERIKKLRNFSQRLLNQPDICKELKEWNLQLSSDLVRIVGRVLPPENIVQGANRKHQTINAEWTKALRANPMLSFGQINQWVSIFPRTCARDTENLVSSLQKAFSGMSFKLPRPKDLVLNDDRNNSFIQAIEEASQYNPSIILITVPNQKSDRYAAIKKKCYVDKGIPCQVVQTRTLMKNIMSVATKVAIQMNCKLGGAPWTVEFPRGMDLMVVGYDVCHDTQNKSRSFGAMVSSLDPNCTRFYSTVNPHTSGEELSDHLAANVIKAIKQYEKYNKKPPAKIVIYRDGVGDGQLNYVYQHEVQIIVDKLKAVYIKAPLQMAFIVVSKKIKTRIFNEHEENPPPGTVVDDVITLPERYDFFIVPQCVTQGSASPTSYNVLHDTLGWDPDKIQRLTFKMCHMYFNWSGTVRVPAPCQYAHKLAFMAGQFLHKTPHADLETTLYYL